MVTAEHSATYSKNRRDRGEVRISLWVPSGRVDELRQIAEAMRAQADLKAGRSSKTPSVQIPKLEIPELDPPGWSYLKIGREEIALHMILRENGARWRNETKDPAPATWKIRSDLVEKLGLEARVVLTEDGLQNRTLEADRVKAQASGGPR